MVAQPFTAAEISLLRRKTITVDRRLRGAANRIEKTESGQSRLFVHRRNQQLRIDARIGQVHAPVEVRPCHPAGGPNLCNELALFHHLSHLDQDFA